MIKTKAHLETTTASGEHAYFCGTNTPVTEVIEALKTFLTHAYGILKQQEEQAQQKAQDVEPKSECKDC